MPVKYVLWHFVYVSPGETVLFLPNHFQKQMLSFSLTLVSNCMSVMLRGGQMTEIRGRGGIESFLNATIQVLYFSLEPEKVGIF